MRRFTADEVAAALPYPALVERLRLAFRNGAEMPTRHHHKVAVPGEPDAMLLLMPAWTPGEYLGVKIAGVFPGNGPRGLDAVQASYVLFSARTGEPLAVIDGGELTARRTAAASALAAADLARADARVHLIIGSGRMARYLAHAHAAVRPIEETLIAARDPAKAEALATTLRAEGLNARAVTDADAAHAEADILSTATLSTMPLVKGALLRPGQHIDLVGAFTPAMRESDDEAMRRARVYLDVLDGCLKEGGDVVQAIASGAITPEAVIGDLAGLAAGRVAGRRDDNEITLFKSVGCALEDLAAAAMVYESGSGEAA